MTNHDIKTELTTLGFQAQVVEQTLPALIEGYLAAVKDGLVKEQLTPLQLEYLGEMKGVMAGTVEKVKVYVQNVQSV